MQPLYAATTGKTLNWNAFCWEAFARAKDALMSVSVLAYLPIVSIICRGSNFDQKILRNHLVCELHCKQCKWVDGSYFLKVNQLRKTKGIGKIAQRIFRGIGTGLFGCGEDGYIGREVYKS